MASISLLDYGAGNVRSVINAFQSRGHKLHIISNPDEILQAERLVFPGVGAFGACMRALEAKGYKEPLLQYIKCGKPFFGICIGLQSLFEESEESPGVPGLGIFKRKVTKFNKNLGSVPHMGWNGLKLRKNSSILPLSFENQLVYFVHSYCVLPAASSCSSQDDWVLATTDYANQEFVSVVEYKNIFATQFHPEKSGKVGLSVIDNFVNYNNFPLERSFIDVTHKAKTSLAKRIIACLDVRSNDDGDLVVTKGDQYDVREHSGTPEKGQVRNMGKPIELAQRYFEEGADEITFLNITSFRNCPLKDLPILELLKKTSETVYVPLTIGGGIKNVTDPDGKFFSALEVASEYFRSGADKVSIGSDAVDAVEEYLKNGKVPTGKSSIEQIAEVYGSQAVVISIDPIRVYVNSPNDTPHTTVKHKQPGPNNEPYCWYQCTVHGGRAVRDIDVVQLATVCETLGAGEILLNSINQDGTNAGYDTQLIKMVKDAVSIPVIASSGAGSVDHFKILFDECPTVEAALAAGIFHRKEVSIQDVKQTLQKSTSTPAGADGAGNGRKITTTTAGPFPIRI